MGSNQVVAERALARGAALSVQIFSKVVTAAAVAVTGDPGEFEKIAHSVSSLWFVAITPHHSMLHLCAAKLASMLRRWRRATGDRCPSHGPLS